MKIVIWKTSIVLTILTIFSYLNNLDENERYTSFEHKNVDDVRVKVTLVAEFYMNNFIFYYSLFQEM